MKRYTFIFMMLITMTMIGYRTTAPMQTSSQTDSLIQRSVFNVQHSAVRDTVAVFDSMHIHERNDTMFVEHLRSERRERIIFQTDTLQLTDMVRIEIHDTIQTIIPSESKEQHPPNILCLLVATIGEYSMD